MKPTTQQPSQPLVTRPASSIKSLLQGDQFKSQVARALPSHLKPDRFIRVALTTLMRTPKLAQCDQASFINSLLTLSQLGLEPDGRRAHLIPFENRKRGVVECQLIIDYKGLAELAMRSGVVSNIHADIVCENDEFSYDRGQITTHRIDFRKPRGAAYAAYAICRFKDGTEKADVMSFDDIESIRARSRAGQSGPWQTDWAEMAKKTVFRRLSKWLPLSAEFRDAVAADEDEVEVSAPMPTAGGVAVIPFNEKIAALHVSDDSSGDNVPMEDPPTMTAPVSAESVSVTTSPPPEPPTVDVTPQVALSNVVTGAGFTFSHLQRWGMESGNIPNADSLSGFRDLPSDVCARLLRAQKGLLQGLAMVKGGDK